MLKGSCRTIYFNKHPISIILDGVEIQLYTVDKIAKSHKLDREEPLGKHQNKVECSDANRNYDIFVKISDEYKTNVDGILSPVMQYSKDFSGLEMVKVFPINEEIFRELTKTEIYLSGLNFKETVDALHRKFIETTNRIDLLQFFVSRLGDYTYNSILEHPWVSKYISWMIHTNNSSIDFTIDNLGYIIHPLTHKKYLVLCDYGYSIDYADNYSVAFNESIDQYIKGK